MCGRSAHAHVSTPPKCSQQQCGFDLCSLAVACALLFAGSARTGVDWSKLPPELLPTILQFVPQQHRFSSCVAVNPAWAAAAVAATRSISIKQDQPKLLQQAWAACAPRFAAQLTHLTLWTRHEPGWGTFNSKLHLPCAGLCSLKVSSCSMQLKSVPSRASSSPAHSAEAAQDQKAGPAGPSWPGLLDSATGLTRLSLTCHELCGTAALLALTDLQDLMLTVSGGSYEQWPHEAAVLLPDSFMAQLSGLTKLTSLQLSATYLQLWSGAGMQHVSHLTRLQRLSLRCSSWDWFGLELKHEQDDKVLFPGSGTVLECLTALTRLKLCGSSVGPLPSLSAMPALEHFVLANCPGWDPAMLAGATGLQHLAIAAPVQGRWCLDAASDDLLLAALQQQTQLTYLKVHQFSPWRADPSALTASTNLRKLHLEEFEAPYGAWGQLCPPERQLQHLTQLEVSGIGVARTVEDLQSLVQGCPALQQLTLRLHLRNLHDTFAEQQFGVLAELSHLTRLIVSNVTDKNIRQLRQLTQLQELHMPNSKLSFAALKRLKRGLKKMQHLKHLTVPLPLPQLSARCTSGTAFTCASQVSFACWARGARLQPVHVAVQRACS